MYIYYSCDTARFIAVLLGWNGRHRDTRRHRNSIRQRYRPALNQAPLCS